MRVLQSSLYSNFLNDQKSAKTKIESLTTQLSSGKKIAHSYEDSDTYIQTLRLDSEINSYKGIQDRIQKSKVLTDSSDSALSSVMDSIKNIRNKMIQAGNGTVNDEGLKSIAIEVENEKSNIIRLLNSSVNGEYIFAGSAVNIKPVDDNGEYFGNGEALEVAIDKANKVPYSVSGEELLYGLSDDIQKRVSSNVKLYSQNPADAGKNVSISKDSSIEDLTGKSGTNFFYINGTKHNGENFKSKISLNSSDKVSDLIQKISNAYGENVNVSLNKDSTITVEDKLKGKSGLDFQMISSTQDVAKTSQLTAKFDFNKSTDIEAVAGVGDSTYFRQKDNRLIGNIPLYGKDGFATSSTTLSESANTSLDGKSFTMKVVDINGTNRDVSIDLSNSSTFTLDGQTYDITDASLDPATNTPVSTKADEFTYGQLSGIISLALFGDTPASGTKTDVDSAINRAKDSVFVGINKDGLLEAKNVKNNSSSMKLSIYDRDSDDFSKGGSLKFMSNRAVIDRDNRVDLLSDLDEILDALNSGNRSVGSSNSSDPKNIGVANSLAKIDNLFNHVSNKLSKIGSLSKNLQSISDRSTTLELNTKEFKSKISDVDIAEVALNFQQISLNYQAMMSTISKVNSLTLLNYLK